MGHPFVENNGKASRLSINRFIVSLAAISRDMPHTIERHFGPKKHLREVSDFGEMPLSGNAVDIDG